ncbi:MAG: glycosyltransferase [Desulfobacterales bacterium]|nr:glycosyltransferase [Desulfobacterales bacterium]
MKHPEVTILIPNYRTLAMTTLCLRLLRKYSDPSRVHVIVIDNHSGDASLDYLRQLKWIELIERPSEPDETPSRSHARALDLGLARARTPFVLSLHTDTFVRSPQWLDVLLAPFDRDARVAGVGSWKLEPPPPVAKRLGKQVELRGRLLKHRFSGNRAKARAAREQLHSGYYRLFGAVAVPRDNVFEGHYFLRSHCALYRTDLIQRYGLSFAADGDTAGKGLHQALVAHGHRMVFMPVNRLTPHIIHVNHATLVLHPELGSSRKNITRGRRRIQRIFRLMDAEAILRDASLDT